MHYKIKMKITTYIDIEKVAGINRDRFFEDKKITRLSHIYRNYI